MKHRKVSSLATVAFAAAVTAAGAAHGQNASSVPVVPDAQVESNVLKALASDASLSSQNIQTSTTYGVVTMTGSINDEALRAKAENIVARVAGVKKVIDEMTLGSSPAGDSSQAAGAATAAMGQANPDQSGVAPEAANMAAPTDAQGQPLQMQADGTYAPAAPPSGVDSAYPEQSSTEPSPAASQPPTGRRPLYSNQSNYQQAPSGPTQVAGLPVTVAPGALLQIRINRGIDSNHIRPGTPFDGTVMSDILGSGAVAIPRGASVQGVVVDAEKTKHLSGRGELALQITSVTLGGQVYPLQSSVWNREGADKSKRTVGSAVGMGAFGALFGALVGGGAGAAIGAGVGAGAGVAASAGSQGGSVLIAPESILTFHITQPVNVRTVSEQEMQRLAYIAGPNQPQGPPQGYYPQQYSAPYPPPPPAYYVGP